MLDLLTPGNYTLPLLQVTGSDAFNYFFSMMVYFGMLAFGIGAVLNVLRRS